jgi:hypothetical protein
MTAWSSASSSLIMAARSACSYFRAHIVSSTPSVSLRCCHSGRPFCHAGLSSQFIYAFIAKRYAVSASYTSTPTCFRRFSVRGARKAESSSSFVHALRAASEVQLINSSMDALFSFSSPAQREQFQHCVLLVDVLGGKVGSMSLNQAVAQASAGKLHLSVVAASSVPPIIKLISAESVIANESKKVAVDRESRSKKSLEKEIQMMMNIAPNDVQVKVAKILDFCQKGCRVSPQFILIVLDAF